MKYVSVVLRVDRILEMGSAELLTLCKVSAVTEILRNSTIDGGRVVESLLLHRTMQIFADRLKQNFNYHFQCLSQDYFEYLFYPDLEMEGLNLFTSLIASSYVDDLLNTHVLTCARLITSQLW